MVLGKDLSASMPGGFENLKLADTPAAADRLSGATYYLCTKELF
jgi:hypothetical protein